MARLFSTKKISIKVNYFRISKEFSLARLVTVGLIQNQIVLATTEPIENQRFAIHSRVTEIIEVAYRCGVNIVCLQEAWSKFSLYFV